MAGPKHQPEKVSNKDDSGENAPPTGAEPPAAGRQPQRPGQDARFEEQPGSRDHVSGTSVPTAPKKR